VRRVAMTMSGSVTGAMVATMAVVSGDVARMRVDIHRSIPIR
jgi:hypothetical protein